MGGLVRLVCASELRSRLRYRLSFLFLVLGGLFANPVGGLFGRRRIRRFLYHVDLLFLTLSGLFYVLRGGLHVGK